MRALERDPPADPCQSSPVSNEVSDPARMGWRQATSYKSMMISSCSAAHELDLHSHAAGHAQAVAALREVAREGAS